MALYFSQCRISSPRELKVLKSPQHPGVHPTSSPGSFHLRQSSWSFDNPICRQDDEMTMTAPVQSTIRRRFCTAPLSKRCSYCAGSKWLLRPVSRMLSMSKNVLVEVMVHTSFLLWFNYNKYGRIMSDSPVHNLPDNIGFNWFRKQGLAYFNCLLKLPQFSV